MDNQVSEKAKAQEKYCDETGAPMFAPRSGFCYRCGRQIYEYYTLEQAGKKLITGCPYCHYSYCD